MHPHLPFTGRALVFAGLDSIADAISHLMIDAGISLSEMTEIIRVRMVKNAADMLQRDFGRLNRSRLAALTGLPRADVSRILRNPGPASARSRSKHPVFKVLNVWCSDPRFATRYGYPDPLPVFGKKKRSFEKLVSMSASGIPVRAMLDQLSAMKVVELLPDQTVKVTFRKFSRAKARTNSIGAIGMMTKDLIETLKYGNDRERQSETVLPPLEIVGRRKNLRRAAALKTTGRRR